jgi:hypothetical protein
MLTLQQAYEVQYTIIKSKLYKGKNEPTTILLISMMGWMIMSEGI